MLLLVLMGMLRAPHIAFTVLKHATGVARVGFALKLGSVLETARVSQGLASHYPAFTRDCVIASDSLFKTVGGGGGVETWFA